MALIIVGALLMVLGVALSATGNAKRGRLSKPPAEDHGETLETLEPPGRGKTLSIKPSLPGMALVVLGGVLILAGSAGYE